VTELEQGYLGPSPELMDVITKAMQAPFSPETFGTDEEQDARRARLIAATDFEDLAPADQDWLKARCREVEDGYSPTWQDPASWGGDWAHTDAEIDAEEEGASGEAKALPPDADGWVGV
jgi:hypothetical protein